MKQSSVGIFSKSVCLIDGNALLSYQDNDTKLVLEICIDKSIEINPYHGNIRAVSLVCTVFLCGFPVEAVLLSRGLWLIEPANLMRAD